MEAFRKRAQGLLTIVVLVTMCASHFLKDVESAAAGYRRSGIGRSMRSLLDNSSKVSIKVSAETFAELEQAILQANANKQSTTVVLTSDIVLLRPLPPIAYGTGIGIYGSCTSLDKKTSRKCIIDGAHSYAFLTGQFNCYIALENVIAINMVNGVHKGGCSFSARRSVFRNNVADVGGAVLNTDGFDPVKHVVWTDQFTECAFINNSATSGPGGAIYSRGPIIRIGGCKFFNNSAEGDGGAIASLGDVYIHSSLFDGNVAGGSGGAIYTTSSAFTSINSVLTNNVAGDGGGAVYVEKKSLFRAASSIFCASKVAQNSAPGNESSANLHLSGVPTPSYCGVPLPPGTETDDGTTPTANCTGCTGCSGDCNGNGVCSLDADYNGNCNCQAAYDPSTSCSACLQGYALSSGCTTCAPGYIRSAPSSPCTACRGLQEVLTVFLDMAIDFSPAADYKACQARCASSTAANYCNLWAYIGSESGESACAGKCLMANNLAQCRVSEVFTDPIFGIKYQHIETAFVDCTG